MGCNLWSIKMNLQFLSCPLEAGYRCEVSMFTACLSLCVIFLLCTSNGPVLIQCLSTQFEPSASVSYWYRGCFNTRTAWAGIIPSTFRLVDGPLCHLNHYLKFGMVALWLTVGCWCWRQVSPQLVWTNEHVWTVGACWPCKTYSKYRQSCFMLFISRLCFEYIWSRIWPLNTFLVSLWTQSFWVINTWGGYDHNSSVILVYISFKAQMWRQWKRSTRGFRAVLQRPVGDDRASTFMF